MKLKLTIIAMTLALWLCPQGFAASAVLQKYASIANDSGNVVVLSVLQVSDLVAGACDLTCTYVNYSFCADETPGCIEGFMEVPVPLPGEPSAPFKGNVGASPSTANSLTLNTEIISGSPWGNSYYCYAWDSDGNCTDEVGIIAPNCTSATCPIKAGTIDLTFTKVPYDASLTNDVSLNPYYCCVSASGPAYYQEIVDQFGSSATGTVNGVTVTQNAGFMGFTQVIATPLPASSTVVADSLAVQPVSGSAPLAVQPLSTVLAKSGKVSDKALRRLRALERAQKAYIAQRKGDDLTDNR